LNLINNEVSLLDGRDTPLISLSSSFSPNVSVLSFLSGDDDDDDDGGDDDSLK
jgi:hypothetical protein